MRRASIIAFACALSTISAVHAQTGWGTYQYGSFETAGADTINLGSLNVLLSIPIVNKAGRAGTKFVYNVSYNSTIYSAGVVSGSTTWIPDSNWGWSGQRFSKSGYVTYKTTTGTCTVFSPPHTYHYSYTRTSNFTFIDAAGSAHRFRGIETVSDNCGDLYNTDPFPISALDSSGLVMNEDFTIVDRYGNVIVPSAPGSPGTYIDSNGNEISDNGTGTFTDTLGYTALTVTSPSPPTLTYTYKDTSGTGRTISESYATYNVKTNFGCTGISEISKPSTSLVDRITFYDGSYYAFTYETTPGYSGYVTGRLASVQLPTGGTITYTYGGPNNGISCSDGTAEVLTRVDSDGTRTYTRSGISSTNSVTDVAKGSSPHHTIYNFLIDSTNGGLFYNSEMTVYPGAATGAALLDSVICYNGNTTSCGTTTAVPTTPMSEVGTTSTYDGASSGSTNGQDLFINSDGTPAEQDQYDFGTGGSRGSLLQKTVYTYSLGLSYEIDDVSVKDGAGNLLSESVYYYDVGADASTTGIPQHVTPAYARHNLNSVSISHGTGVAVGTSYSYDDTGEMISTANGFESATTIQYDSGTNSFPTKITYPDTTAGGSTVHHITYATFDPNTGLQTSATDQNGNITTYTYDQMLRPTLVQYPLVSGATAHAQTAYTYTAASFGPFHGAMVETDVAQVSGSNITATATLDGYGRQVTVMQTDSAGDSSVDSVFDAEGRLHTVSNPHRSTSNTTDGITTYGYDALNRTTSTIAQDGLSTSTSAWTGNANVLTDAAGNQRKTIIDGLGRTSIIWEPDSSGTFTYETDYLYQQNVTTSPGTYQTIVHQKGGSSSSSDWHTRTFTFDLAGRVLSENTPEAGTTSYTYPDGTGSECTGNASAVCTRTDNLSTTTTYAYDGLERPTGKAYTGTGAGATVASNTPPVTYYYDQSSYNGLTIANGIGNLTGMSDGSGSTAWQYDTLNRPTDARKTINSHTLQSTVVYNLDSTVNTLSDFGGTTLTYGYDNTGRPTSVVDGSGNSYASSGTYYPPGLLSGLSHQMTSGASYSHSNQFNSLLQPTAISASRTSSPSATLMSYSLAYGTSGYDNGNISAIADNANTTWNQNYSYDKLNRLTTAQNLDTTHGTGWTQSFTINPWGNITSETQSGAVSGFSPSAFETNNQLSALGYDGAGRVTNDGFNVYTYDAEGRLLTVNSDGYVYDGADIRVKKTVSGTDTLYWPGMTGQIIDESDSSAATIAKQVYFGGTLVWRESAAGNPGLFLFQDHLGSTRVTADASGTVTDSVSYYPYGGHISYSSTSSDNHYGFTSYEEDGDSDYAVYRNLNTTWGRFNRPDPYDGSYDFSNPQSLNRYSYVGNIPTSNTDPLGLLEDIYRCGTADDGTAIYCMRVSTSGAALPGNFFAVPGVIGTLTSNGSRNGGGGKKPGPSNGITKAQAACAADVAINYGLGFIPGYNAAKLAFTVAGGNVNFVQNALSGKSIVTFSNPFNGNANIFWGLNGLASGYNAIMQAAKTVGPGAVLDDVAKAAGTAGTVANLVNTASALNDLYGCRNAK